MDDLEYKRNKALEWLKSRLTGQVPSDLDSGLDDLVRKSAGLSDGDLYGFVQKPLGPSQIRSKQDTIIKIKPVASNYLLDTEKTEVPKGKIITFKTLYQDKHQHLFLEVSDNKKGYIYGPHFELPDKIQKRDVKLEVPYFYQRDNWTKYHGPGGRQCCLTSHCMAVDYLLKGKITMDAKARGLQEAEDLYGEVLDRYGDTTDPQAHTPALKAFHIDSYFTYTGSIKDLLLCLDQGVPVPLGVAYTASGHYVCAVGHKSDGVYIHDPFGTRMGLTDNYEPTPGKFDFVTWDWLQAKWVDQGSEAGWMRVITSVEGNPTGVPGNL